MRDFIEVPALSLAAEWLARGAGADVAQGQRVGAYRIIREIGRGGMGAVFLAERSDGEFRQEAALKVVRRSFADSELKRRFRQERQILASLNHPNIARLLDGGVSADGEPYLVMEYVEGERVDDYCEARRLSTRARLRLFLGVCRGVSYAHRHLVVHRDIKPGNILVTPEGVPKLLDFGIAKLLGPAESGEQTLAGMRAFTPDYAAPEQMTAGGHITTATDVYSLGVLLGDLLGGSRRGRGAAGRRRHGTPARTVATNLPTDQDGAGKGRAGARKAADSELDNIVAMARREDPARRYATADELADDVGRYLEGRPVRAQKDSLTYRAGKFVRRNRAGVAAAALAVASLVAGLGVAVWQARAAARERDRAERRFDDVRQLSNALLSDIAPKIERLPGSTHARQSLVGQSLKYLDSLAGESADDRVLQAELASAYEKVGASQGAPERPNLGDYPGAVASYRKAQSIRRRLLELDPADAENRRRLAASYNDLAAVLYWTNDYAGALEAHAEALRLYESLAAERPADLRLRLALAETR
ncbi:MAG TPA: serine/threonine-protein kinase, partial [Pyrinomonadaceae bacterium]